MYQAAVTEFPFVDALPKKEKGKIGKLWDHLASVKAAMEKHGVLLPQHYAADLLGISRQRVHVLVNEGRFQVVDIGGCRYVTEDSIVAYAKSARVAGRPGKAPVAKVTWKIALDSAREFVSKNS